MDHTSPPVYNALHSIPENYVIEGVEAQLVGDIIHPEKDEEYYVEDYDDDEHDVDHHDHHKHGFKRETLESFDFTDTESTMWKKVLEKYSSFRNL
jgi:hypothetical protein